MLPALSRYIPIKIREQQDSDTDSDVVASSVVLMITLVIVTPSYELASTYE